MPTRCQTADQPDTTVAPHQAVSVLAHSGEKSRLCIDGVRAKVVHPGQFQAGHYTVTKSVPQCHCIIVNGAAAAPGLHKQQAHLDFSNLLLDGGARFTVVRQP